MAHKVISKVNARFTFLHRKNKSLTPICVTYDATPSFNLVLIMIAQRGILIFLKPKIETWNEKQNSNFIRFCLQLHIIIHISQNNFYHISQVFYKQCPHYLNEIFVKTPESSITLKKSYHKLKLQKTSIGQSTLPSTDPA